MAVFVAAGDESDGPTQRGPFVYGGFVAPSKYWIESFAPTWEKFVLNDDPPIPFMHMADIRRPSWREQHGLTAKEAERRVDAATAVIAQASELCALKTQFDGGHFRDIFGQARIVRFGKQPATYRFEPDYVACLGVAYAALDCVYHNYPDAEKVDFVVERKTKITHHLGSFHENLEQGFQQKGRSELIRLIGDLIPGGKERVPLQAADVAVWHFRREACQEANAEDLKRLGWMFDRRPIMTNGLTLEEISLVGQRSKSNTVPSPFPPKPKLRDGAA